MMYWPCGISRLQVVSTVSELSVCSKYGVCKQSLQSAQSRKRGHILVMAFIIWVEVTLLTTKPRSVVSNPTPSFYDPELSCGPSCQNIGTYHLAGIGRRSMSFDESERLGYLAQTQ